MNGAGILLIFSMSRYYQRTLSYVALLMILLFTSPTDSCFPGGRLIRRLPKKEPALIFKQHVPNVPETSITASGPREGRIRRNDRRFKELITNYNPDVIFKDEELTGADRIMSLRCKEKLDALSMLVMNYWPGVKLRVIEAWHESNVHPPDSLHYEGRAVDITTSDRDKSKYGMLARLAAQAGFDWVLFEHRGHVHASVKSDAITRNKRTLRCFPESSTVMTSAGVFIPMSALRRGDTILSISKNDNKIVFSPVLTFLHVEKSTYGEFLRITTENGTKLTISADHLMYKLEIGTKLLKSVFARNLSIGDRIFVYNANDVDTFSYNEKVVNVKTVTMKGLYAPLTDEGAIVVDGVPASCYAGTRSENLAHTVMTPLRLWYRLLNLLSEKYFTDDNNNLYLSSSNHSDDGDGVHFYANFLWWLADLLEHFNLHSYLDHF